MTTADAPDLAGGQAVRGAPEIAPAAAAAHRAALDAGEDTYTDPETGYMVMTAATLADRGHCCGSGCRHCPYPPDEQRWADRPGS